MTILDKGKTRLEFFNSHPLPATRVRDLESKMAEADAIYNAATDKVTAPTVLAKPR